MLKSPTYAALGEEIRSVLRQKKLTQVMLSNALDISKPAVTQLLSGEIHLSASRFEQILEFLDPDRETRANLYKMFRQASRASSEKDPLLKNFGFLLQQRELSLPMLSNRTGIAVEKLNSLAAGKPTYLEPEQDLRLRKTLCVHDPESTYRTGDDFQEQRFDAESYALPLLHADDFDFFRKSKSLSILAMERAQCNIFWDLSSENFAVAVLAPCSQLQLTLPGFALIAVSDPLPVRKYKWKLQCDINGVFTILEKHGKSWVPLRFTDPAAVREDAVWSLPVLDMAFKLFDPTPRKDN